MRVLSVTILCHCITKLPPHNAQGAREEGSFFLDMTKQNTSNEQVPEVLIYGMITGDMAAKVAEQIKFYESFADQINVRLNSPGGSIYDGLAIYNCLKNCSVPVDVYIDGIAASMGAYIAFAGRKIYISKYGRVMVHEGNTPQGGTATELRETADMLEGCNKNLMDITMKRTGLAEAEVKAKFFNGQDNWYTAVQAKNINLVDDIYDLDGVDVAEAASHTEVYAMVAQWNDQPKSLNTINMSNKMTPEALAELGLNASASDTEINAALINRNTLLSQKLKAQEEAGKKKEVGELLASALTAGKITAEFKAELESQYGTNPEGLGKILTKMPAFSSVSEAVNTQNTNRGGDGSYKPEAVALMKEGWDALDKSGRLKQLKQTDETAYLALYKQKFGYEPNGKPKPAFVDRDIANRK